MRPRPAAALLAARLREDPVWRDRVVHVEALPARAAVYEDLDLAPPLARALASRGIARLYSHQAVALRAVRAGEHTAVATPTASGKSLVYLLALWERRLAGGEPTALYLSPLKALAQDQRRSVEELGAPLAPEERLSAALYDGDTPASARGKIRAHPPALVLTNPDMVHLSLLASHAGWAPFLSKLAYVVLDEAHAYRGVFGSHVAGILRRLGRVCAHYGSRPTFVAASATLANPAEFLARLTGERFTVVTESGAPTPPRWFALVKPAANAYTESCELLEAFLAGGLKTIAFTKARKITELLAMWLAERAPGLAGRVKAYRAGYLPEERRALERALAEDRLDGVIATSALELGIDIGGLDGCLLVGFPGTQLSTWQRAGRVGRGADPALIALVGMEDALDQYYLDHPREFFARPPERLLLDEANAQVLKAHLVCAAAELPLAPADAERFGPTFPARVAELAAEGRLLEGAADGRWFSPLKQPQRHVSIRSAGESWLIATETGAPLGTVDGFRAYREVHPRAIYLHAGVTYEVTEFSEDARRVRVREVVADHYTQPVATEETKVLAVLGTRPFGPGTLAWGDVRVTSRVIGYERKLVRGGVSLGEHPLTLPPQAFETQGVWLAAPAPVQRELAGAGRDLMGSLHALEHAAIALFPLLALCDRWDLGGISTPYHPDTGTASVFIYDGVPGGVGLARFGYEVYGEWLARVAAHLAECPCAEGCPACVYSPKCGSRNVPLDKAGALLLARAMLDGAARPADRRASPATERGGLIAPAPVAEPLRPPAPRPPVRLPAPGHLVVFDLETQRLAEDVGGWDRKRDMRLSVGVVYDVDEGAYRDYREHEVDALVQDLKRARLVVGFNIRSFDYEVLAAYVPRAELDALPTLDLLEKVHATLKRRVRLDDLAAATLGKAKQADGVEAVRLFRAGDFERLTAYCRHDVLLTKELFEFGAAEGFVRFPSAQGVMKLPVQWGSVR